MSDRDTPVAQLPDDPQALLAGLAGLEHPPVGASPWVFVLAAMAALCVLLLSSLVYRWWRRRQRLNAAGAWKLAADHELSDLRERVLSASDETSPDDTLDPGFCASILGDASVLTRRIALVAEPRADIAPLSGAAWLTELDRLACSEQFTTGSGQLLATGPYERSPRHKRSVLLGLVDAIEILSERVARHQSQEMRR